MIVSYFLFLWFINCWHVLYCIVISYLVYVYVR
nr:MAG TPA: hypothetical protein [Caudoviricetes sp.]